MRDVVNSTGTLLNHLVYDSYGIIVSQSDATQAPRFTYTGMQADAQSGLLYDFHRYYDPINGRFVSQDPKGFAAGDGNLYRYVRNSPMNGVDPSGLNEEINYSASDQGQGFDQGSGGSFATDEWEAGLTTQSSDRSQNPEGKSASSTNSNIQVRQMPLAFQSPRCVACHNPIIMFGGSFDDLPASYRMAALAFANQTTPTIVASDFGTRAKQDILDVGAAVVNVGISMLNTSEEMMNNRIIAELQNHPDPSFPLVDSRRAVDPLETNEDYVVNTLFGTSLGMVGSMYAMNGVANLMGGAAPSASSATISGGIPALTAEDINAGSAASLSVSQSSAENAPITQPIGDLRSAGLKDAHHVIQDAAVRDLPQYDTSVAPGVQLAGPSSSVGTPHYEATQIQRTGGGGTYGVERGIAYNALRAAGYSDSAAAQAIQEADKYFNSIGVNENTPTRVPGNRR